VWKKFGFLLLFTVKCIDVYADQPMYAPEDAVQLRADSAFEECAEQWNQNPTRGSDRAFRDCEETRGGVYAEATGKIFDELKNIVPEKCQDAVTSFGTSFKDFAVAQQSFSQQIVQPAPGGGEWDKAEFDTLAAKSNYLYLKSLVNKIENGMWPPICRQ